jgi:GNAT superfamily N-acetyltransferase
MPDLLVNLYELPASGPALERLRNHGIEVRRGIAAEKSTVVAWVGKEFSVGWSCECELAFTRQPVACIIAVRGEILCGFSCYGIVCPDFFGPLGVAAEWRKHDIGTALLLAGLEALRAQGYAYAIIGWAGPVAFFEKTVGAKVIENSQPGIYRGILKNRGET